MYSMLFHLSLGWLSLLQIKTRFILFRFSARATPESGFLDDQSDDVAVAGGIGLGYRFGDFGQIEVDYSGDTGNNAFGSYGVSALVKF